MSTHPGYALETYAIALPLDPVVIIVGLTIAFAVFDEKVTVAPERGKPSIVMLAVTGSSAEEDEDWVRFCACREIDVRVFAI